MQPPYINSTLIYLNLFIIFLLNFQSIHLLITRKVRCNNIYSLYIQLILVSSILLSHLHLSFYFYPFIPFTFSKEVKNSVLHSPPVMQPHCAGGKQPLPGEGSGQCFRVILGTLSSNSTAFQNKANRKWYTQDGIFTWNKTLYIFLEQIWAYIGELGPDMPALQLGQERMPTPLWKERSPSNTATASLWGCRWGEKRVAAAGPTLSIVQVQSTCISITSFKCDGVRKFISRIRKYQVAGIKRHFRMLSGIRESKVGNTFRNRLKWCQRSPKWQLFGILKAGQGEMLTRVSQGWAQCHGTVIPSTQKVQVT